MSDKKLGHFEIRFDSGAWDSSKQRGNLHTRRTYSADVAEIQSQVECLDRYDDFRTLKIDADEYEQQGGAYGIPRDDDEHIVGGQHVLFDHQIVATRRFLSELRGFGLLADVVGSGKTYEACAVLSELAARNRIKNMLIVVPGQVFDSWVEVLENRFGLGKGALYQVRAPKDIDEQDVLPVECTYNSVLKKVGATKEGSQNSGTIFHPNRPIIVDVKVFAQWEIQNNVVFDVIVVDEAHHLCKEDGEYAKAMKLLSHLMEIKKKFGSATYCLLLSATPHSGNLENMFRLWYFIRCKGGEPSDFDEKEDASRSQNYNDEKKYYKEVVCHGATNITDFIRVVKLSEVTLRFRKELDGWLAENHPEVKFDKLTDYSKSTYIEKFLLENESIKNKVMEKVAHEYHAVLRSIMIRQPNSLSRRRKKIIKNVLFYPVAEKIYSQISKVQINGFADKKITIDFTGAGLNSDFLPNVINEDGDTVSLVNYVGGKKGNRSERNAYALLVYRALAEFEKKYSALNKQPYTKKGYVNYYYNRLDSVLENNAWKQTALLPVVADGGKLGYKYDYLTQLFHKHAKERIIVFFDYELDKKDSVIDDVVAALQADSAFKKRLILSDSASEETIIQRFDEKEDAILIVKTSALTEGANLQSCNIIVNYQVTPDPLAMDQRIGRVFRLGQKHDVTIYSFADVNRLEGFALAYFISIGLISSNSGDATILAGSNSDQMVAIRCQTCSNVKLMSRMVYEECCQGDKQDVICHHTGTDKEVGYEPCEMMEINVNEVKCDKCGSLLARSARDEGYECLSVNNLGESGKMCMDGDQKDRKIYCSKPCAMSHCSRLTENVNCPVVKLHREGKSEDELKIECRACGKCAGVWEKCRVKYDVSGCRNCQFADCTPKPYVLHFNDKWEAPCPRCSDHHKRGTLRPIIPKTFATYIRNLWGFELDRGEGFCTNLDAEAHKVGDVKSVLAKDDEEK